MGTLGHWEDAFNSVGWFIPPYVEMGILGKMAAEIKASGGRYDQADLEVALGLIYEEEGLAAKVLHRYPIAPVINNYSETISEAIEAHFFGLHHVAIGGLVPVIEGAGRELSRLRGIAPPGVRAVFVTAQVGNSIAVPIRRDGRAMDTILWVGGGIGANFG